jgi:Concanavalin A-like lectin/glucanases superfamily
MTTVSMLLGNVTSGYPVKNSLRFRSSASAYLNRTPSASSNQGNWTWSAWIKRGSLGSNQVLFSAYSSSNYQTYFQFTSGDNLQFYNAWGTDVENLITTQVFRDPSAWYHIVLAINLSLTPYSNGVKIYVNGVQITSFSTSSYTNTYQAGAVNGQFPHSIGSMASASSYSDCYLAEINFIDGSQLTPSSFGTYDSNGVWQPINYSGSYGTNGFYLPFSNTTSTTTLGYDSSGNGNNWTTNNISLTSGTTYDSMTDSPTVTSASVANYAVWNVLDISGGNSSRRTMSNGNLQADFINSGFGAQVYSTVLFSSSKYYAEFTYSGTMPANAFVGFESSGFSGYYYPNGNYGGNQSGSGWATYAIGDIVSVAVNYSGGSISFYKNNVLQGSITGTGSGAGTFTANGILTSSGSAVIANFGQRPFTYTPPSGYNALNTYNLPAATINNGALYMAATTYTGNGTSQSISNGSNTTIGTTFQPDFVWIKSRSAATDHKLTDSVRGTTKALISDSTAAETTDSNGLTAFGSGGFTVGSDSTYNNNAATYVGWNWKAGGSGGSSNTNGSITSTVSANQTAGFSIATYTGNGTSGATIGHGLGVAPNMVIVKKRNNTWNWSVYHSSVGNTASLFLNLTAASSTAINYWNNTSPTSSVFTVGNDTGVNNGSDTYVAYCFAAVSGYSAFGSYTGNGSTDGPFIYCGFRPRWIMLKDATTSGQGWTIHDSSRDPYNPTITNLFAQSASAEDTALSRNIDFLSNGFKLRSSTGDINPSGDTIIYAAFAENPFNYSRAR